MTDEKEIADFISASNEAIDGKFIVAEKRISSLLRTIAASDRLIENFLKRLRGITTSAPNSGAPATRWERAENSLCPLLPRRF